MKKALLSESGFLRKSIFLLLSIMLSSLAYGQYYIAGNGSSANSWCCGENWNPAGCALTDGSYSTTVPAGTYDFKITNGTWSQNWGISAVDASTSTPGYKGSDNVQFTVAKEANITVSFNSDSKKITLKSDVPFGDVVITSHTVVGEDAEIFGSAWAPANTANDMTKDGDLWKLTIENVSLMSGTNYWYKIVSNHAWNILDYPADDSNAKFEVSQSGTYDVKFEYDEATNTGNAYATKKSEPTTFDSYILVGDAALFVFNWMPSPMGTDMFTLETTDGIHYTKTVNGVPLNVTGTFAYGFSKNGSTTDILFKDKSKTVTIEEAATYNITVALTVAPGEEPDAQAELTKVIPGTTYYITGNGDAETDWCCGESWNPAGCAMESGYFTRDLPAGEYKFKITQGDWVKQSWGYDAVDAAQSTAGYTSDADGNVVFTLETLSAVAVKFDGSKIALQWTAKDEPVPGFDTWTLVGDMPPFPAAWTVEPAFDLQTTDGVVYTLVADDVDMTVDKFQYGFRKNHTEEYAPLAEKYTANLTEGTGNYKVEIALDFTDAAVPKVSVKFTKIPEPVVTGITVNVTVPEGTPACFFYGEMSGNTFVEMTKVDDTHYTTKFEDKESIGWGYLFCWESGNFSTKNTGDNFTDEPVDGVINVEVVGWVTEPGTEYKYTTYTDWKVKSDWNGDWDTAEWLTLTNVSDGVFEGEAAWGTGPGVNLGSESGPVKKDWYPAGDPALTIEEGLAVGQAVKITLTVVDDENVTINVADANPTSADEAVEDAIYANNGTVYCNAPFEIYNLVGQNVTSQNGTLNGVFIVKTANMVKNVLVK